MKQPTARVAATSPAVAGGDEVVNELQLSPSNKERRKPGSSKKHTSKSDVLGSDKSLPAAGVDGGAGKGATSAPVRRRRSIMKPKLTRDEGGSRSGKSNKKK